MKETQSYFIIQRKIGTSRRAVWQDNGFPDCNKSEVLSHLKELRREEMLFSQNTPRKRFRLIKRSIKIIEKRIA